MGWSRARARAHLLRAALVAVAAALAAARLVREPCLLAPATMMLYTSGLSPVSASSEACQRCIAAFAISRINQTDHRNTYAFYDDSIATCHGLYLASVVGMRFLCLDCEAEVLAMRDALDGTGPACSAPMRAAIVGGETGCDGISLETFPFGGVIARVACKDLIPRMLNVFFGGQDFSPAAAAPTGAPGDDDACVKNLSRIATVVEDSIENLPADATLESVRTSLVRTDFTAVDNLVISDMDASAQLANCYAAKPYSLHLRSSSHFCECLTAGSTATRPSAMVSAAQRVFLSTDESTSGVRSVIRESLRRILINIAECFDVPDATYLSPVTANAGPSPLPSPSPTPRSTMFNAPDENPECFPADATATLEDGSVVAMRDLRVGHRVLVAGSTFSDVFLFSHRDSARDPRQFVRLFVASGQTIRLTRGHYIPVGVDGQLRRAGDVNVGDAVTVSACRAGQCAETVSVVVRKESVWSRGLYNPHTVEGTIVVDGVVASTYTTAVHPRLAHEWLLAPVRWVYSAVPEGACRMVLESVLSHGFRRAAALLPSGPPRLEL